MGAKFFSDRSQRFDFPNGAVGFRPAPLPFDTLGPYASVHHCPIEGTDLVLTCYATGYADTHWSIPACTKHKGQHIGGFFSLRSDGGIYFVPYQRYYSRLPMREGIEHA